MGRAHAERLMTSTCTITRDTGETVMDPDTLQGVPVTITVYSGPCKLTIPNTSTVTAQIPGMVIAKDDLILSLPVSTSGGVLTDDVATITANELDLSLIGSRLRVKGVHHQTYATARRFPVEEAS
nr:DUF6093 family protein [Leifsonia psychrotolerans]